MLRRLLIRNYALIEHLELEPEEGFTVLTGETGVGKSILVGALGLLLGEQPGRDTLGAAPDHTEVSAEFAPPGADTPLHQLLGARDLQPAPGDALLLRRILNPRGRGRAYVNAVPIPLQVLREVGAHLADLQGQHVQHSLRRPEIRLALLDAGGDGQKELPRVRAAYLKWEKARRDLRELKNPDDSAGMETGLREQLEELTALAPKPDELEKLFRQQALLAGAESVLETCGAALETLEAEDALLERLHRMREALRELPADDTLGNSVRLMEEAHILLREAASDLRRFTNDLENDPQQLQQVETRLEELHRVARKQNTSPERLPERRNALEQRLRELGAAGRRRAALQKHLRALHASYLEAAAALSARRRKDGVRLAREARKYLARLGIPRPRFLMEIQELSPESPQRNGLQRVAFLFSANPDHDPAPLEHLASGGELSRICLALLTVCGGHGRDLPLLVFDEVDAGVGGAAGERIGHLLSDLAGNRQVLCVTHLPQLAACARNHYRVCKEQQANGRTRIHAEPLSPAQRIEELARMLGGLKITSKTRAHAEELLTTLGGATP